QQQALGEQLPRDPPSRRAERQPHRQLVAAGGRAGDQQVGDVGAGDQQYQADHRQDRRQRALIAAAQGRASARRGDERQRLRQVLGASLGIQRRQRRGANLRLQRAEQRRG